ncbi:2-succinyl-6-hydroxy-2,4-cyclohexadiene-1-carboxylate synthase [Vibrio fortis]|uniref:2-succinyl-6-hydroxy-2, 4-cyclohexadiene-1-carboxylate synthase n=1 Tax=Vibrio fortis TaxID=212667 RepID=UPI0021C27FCA|nr:2-succinyl-6-hydroxy-2,4-cyclohexadiene-1-carboxylate synthase [Vibrio fortis]
MLFSTYYPAKQTSSEKPLLVFLHGLLGSGEDWSACHSYLSEYPRLCIDLPGHGKSCFVDPIGFDHCCEKIVQNVQFQLQQYQLPDDYPIVLIGYSLGGRLAMYGVTNGKFDELNLVKVVVEGGNFGLDCDDARAQRLVHDTQWAVRFAQQSIEDVLDDWYQQSVFSSLNHEQRQTLVIKRSGNLGVSVANMLLSTSLAKQPDLRATLKSCEHQLHYICGKKDRKFIELAESSGFECSQVDHAGHNVHFEQPELFSNLIIQCINKHD